MRLSRRTFLETITVALAGLVVPRILWGQARYVQANPRRIEVTILGMSCPFCAYGVEQKLKRLEGVEDLDVQLKTGVATLILGPGADISNETLIKTVEEAGFEVAAIRRNFASAYPELARDED